MSIVIKETHSDTFFIIIIVRKNVELIFFVSWQFDKKIHLQFRVKVYFSFFQQIRFFLVY